MGKNISSIETFRMTRARSFRVFYEGGIASRWESIFSVTHLLLLLQGGFRSARRSFCFIISPLQVPLAKFDWTIKVHWLVFRVKISFRLPVSFCFLPSRIRWWWGHLLLSSALVSVITTVTTTSWPNVTGSLNSWTKSEGVVRPKK